MSDVDLQEKPGQVLKRRVRPWPPRPVVFVKLGRGMIHENGTVLRLDGDTNLETVLELAISDAWGQDRPRVLYFVGGWDAASTPETEWFETPPGWERPTYRRNPLVADFVHTESKRKLRINMTSEWFGRCDSASICRKAFVRLRELLRNAFDEKVSLMATPARTGLDLIERSLPLSGTDKGLQRTERKPYEYPTLPEDLREKLEHSFGQGRMEWLATRTSHPGATALYSQDAKWMYMACTRYMPVGPVEHDTINELADSGYRPGFYRIHFRVPDGWNHVGIFSTWLLGRPAWPRHADGRTYEAYVVGEEIRLAQEYHWPVEIKERWLFASQKAPGVDLLRTWGEKLKTLRDTCTFEREKELAQPLKDAIRNIGIMAIGSLHRAGRYELVETPIEESEDLPEEALRNLDEDAYGDGSVIRWWRRIPLDPAMQHFAHPEFSIMIWRRAHARVTRAALQVPIGELCAIRNDELITTRYLAWEDDGKVGTFRSKSDPIVLDGRPMPQNEVEYQKLKKGLAYA